MPSFSLSMQASWLNTAVAFDPASFAFSPVLGTKDARTPQKNLYPHQNTKLQLWKRGTELQEVKGNKNLLRHLQWKVFIRLDIPQFVTLLPQTERYVNGMVAKFCITVRWEENDTQQTKQNKKIWKNVLFETVEPHFTAITAATRRRLSPPALHLQSRLPLVILLRRTAPVQSHW